MSLSGLRKYNVTLSASTAGSDLVRLSIRKSGSDVFATGSDWTPAAGDVKVSKDGGAQANIGTLPSYSNGSWEFVLSNTEVTAKTIRVVISATAIVADDFTIETFGNASAMYPAIYSSGSAGNILTSGTGADQISVDGSGNVSSLLAASAIAVVLGIFNRTKGTIWIVDPAHGSDSNAGTWASPFLTPLPTKSSGAHPASAGDVVLICGTTCDLGSSTYTPPTGVTLQGLGRTATTLTSTAGGNGVFTLLVLTSNCVIRGLTVKSTVTPGVNVFAMPIGDSGSTVTNVLLEDVGWIADTDGLYVTGTGSEIVCRNCFGKSNWDLVFIGGARAIVTFIDSPMRTTANNSESPNSNSSIQVNAGAEARFIRSPVENIATTTNASRTTNMVFVRNVNGNGARAIFIDSPIYLNVDGSTINSLVTEANTSIIMVNSPYDPSQVPTQGGSLINLMQKTNVSMINDSSLAAVNQDRASRAIIRGVIGSGATTTLIPTNSLTPTITDIDQLKGRILIFDSDTITAGLRNQASNIITNTNSGIITITALTRAPANGDTFGIY